MKNTNLLITLYCIGALIILSVWLIVFSGGLSPFDLLKFSLLIILSYIIMIFDINIKQIPNFLVFVMIAVWLILVFPMVFYDINFWFDIIFDALTGALIGGGIFLLAYVISKQGLGGGDVKFMAVAGLYLGFARTVPAILYGTVLAALFGLVMILLKKITRKEAIPLAPFLFIGIILTIAT